uniref:Macrophage-expressed gene 1 protein n=1 Tax=Panagrolaimus davidi TaxID=227884 RepID=A0A914PSK4_9BILA
MKLFCLILGLSVVQIFSKTSLLSPVDKCIANIRHDILGKNVSRSLGGIVGVGWDDLTNSVTLPVLSMTYDECLTVPDGDFLIPDNCMAIPKKAVQIEKSSSTHESYESFKHTDSQSISASGGGGAMGVSVSASFNLDMQQAKSHMSKKTQTMAQKKIEYYAFDLIADQGKGFHPIFTQRLKNIANAVLDNNLLLGQYKAEELINDYGTHVVFKAQAGASVTIRSFFTFDEKATSEDKSLQTSASVEGEGFGFKASAKTSVGTADGKNETQKNSKKETFIITKGGPDVNRLLKPDQTDDMLSIDSLVGLKQEGMFLYSLIHPGLLEGYDDVTMNILHDLILNATEEYYRHNTIMGCTNVTAANYNFRANVEDGTCGDSIKTKYGFGGVFQECEYLQSSSDVNKNHAKGTVCDKFRHVNPFASNYSCPHNYESIPLNEIWMEDNTRRYIENTTGCNFLTTIFGCKNTKEHVIHDIIVIRTKWCKSENPLNEKENTIAMFGGIYENDNIFSDEPGCPVGFHEYPFLHNLKICMTKYNEQLKRKSVAFGGLINCQTTDQDCPEGFSRYLAATIDNCPYYYCATVVNATGITTLPKLSRPPYIDRNSAMSKTRAQFRAKMEEMQTKVDENKPKQIKPKK